MHIWDCCKSLLRGADCRDTTGCGGRGLGGWIKDPSHTDCAIMYNKLFLRENKFFAKFLLKKFIV